MNDRVKNPDSVPGSNADAAGNLLLESGEFQRQSECRHSAIGELSALDNSENLHESASMASDSALTNRRSVSSVSIGSSLLAINLPFYLIALLLATTAIAKLWMLLADPFADIRVGIPKEILWLSVALELWLAFENFRIRDRRVLAFVNTVVFGSFAIFASIRWLMGYGSCGCSGKLELPAWMFVLLDIGIVTWFIGRASGRTQVFAGVRELTSWWRDWSPEKRGRLVGLALFGGMVLAIQLPVAAPLRAMALGEPPIQAMVRIDGELTVDRDSTGDVVLWNRSPQPAKIVGLNRSCSCFDFSDNSFSRIIPANERLSLPLVIKPEKTGPLHQRVVLFLDHPEQFRVNIDVVGSAKGEER